MASFFSILKNPYILLGTALTVLLVIFRNQVSGALNQYGGGLGSFGSGVQSFISSISSPRINPTIGLTLGGVFGDIQSGVNAWYNDTYRKGNQNSSSVNSTPSTAGGFNLVQSTTESGGDRERNIARNIARLRTAYGVN